MRSRVEPAVPSPLRSAEWHAGLHGDRADVDVAEEDVPAVLALGIAAAGKFGHGPLKRGRASHGKPLRVAVRRRARHNEGRPSKARDAGQAWESQDNRRSN